MVTRSGVVFHDRAGVDEFECIEREMCEICQDVAEGPEGCRITGKVYRESCEGVSMQRCGQGRGCGLPFFLPLDEHGCGLYGRSDRFVYHHP